MNQQDKITALNSVIDSYVRLVYRYWDGEEQELFGWIYSDHRGITLQGGWIDLEILVRIERRDTGIETVFNIPAESRTLPVLDRAALQAFGYTLDQVDMDDN